MPERIAAVLDDDGQVVNMIVLPETDAQLGWPAEQRKKLRALTDDERKQGVGPGWKRQGNGRFVDERPQPEPEPATEPAPAADLAPSSPPGRSR